MDPVRVLHRTDHVDRGKGPLRTAIHTRHNVTASVLITARRMNGHGSKALPMALSERSIGQQVATRKIQIGVTNHIAVSATVDVGPSTGAVAMGKAVNASSRRELTLIPWDNARHDQAEGAVLCLSRRKCQPRGRCKRRHHRLCATCNASRCGGAGCSMTAPGASHRVNGDWHRCGWARVHR